MSTTGVLRSNSRSTRKHTCRLRLRREWCVPGSADVKHHMTRLTDAEMEARGYSVWLCMDCAKDTNNSEEYYMLWHKVWRRIHYKINGMLCLNCAERRLGRPLNSGDFTKAPVNIKQAAICVELAARLAREVPVATWALSAGHAARVGGDV